MTQTQLLLVIHRREERKTTNTGKLAAECLVHSRVLVRGRAETSHHDLGLDLERQPLLLFPGEGARPLTDYVNCPRPLTLIVPDGTWRQAAKVRHRYPGLDAVPMVALAPGLPTQYRLRQESREGGLSTIEAIARAFGVLEGAQVQDALERVFRIMSERTLWARGVLDSSEVVDGLPEFAQRHDPMSGTADSGSCATKP